MKSQQHHILRSGVCFGTILLFCLGLSQTAFSQTTVTLTDPINDVSFTIPAGATNIIIEVWGAGGAGGGAKKNSAGGGGGGGAYSQSTDAVGPGLYTIQIGAGGTSNGPNDGNPGGDTWFGSVSTVLAKGGGGGLSNGTLGTGGQASSGVGDTRLSGSNGLAGSGTQGGNGGAGANGGVGGNGGNGSVGTNGTAPGGGGGGGGDNNTGGSGANGQIRITYTEAAGCSLTSSGLSNIVCNDNGTPSNPSDDTFTFDLNPTGTNLGATYNITGDVTDSGTYGSATNFGPYPISGGNLSITITDVSGNCSIGETVTAPATCSTDCNLNASGLTNILCNDNGTPGNSADDTFSFDLNPTGTNLGTTYSVSGDVNQSGISYGSATNFSGYLITNGNLTITITDDLDGTCQLVDVLVTAPSHCSGAVCNLTASGLTNILCNDNGTPTIPGDDTFTFDLNPTGTNLGTSYTVSGGASGSGTYGSATTFGPYPISGGNLNITITDDTDGSCTIAETVNAPVPCSTPVCNLTASGLTNITCNDNGTSSDPNDDVFYFDLNPTGTLLGATYSVSGDVAQSGISYGSATNFGPYPISGGNLSITITDVSTDCSFGPFTVTAPASCSNGCNLTSAGLSSLFCDNQGTLSDETDDTFTFTLKPVGTNLGTAYHVSGGITRNSISYGVNELFGPYLISAGPITITITDATDGSCTIDNFEIIPPTTCSLNHTFTTCASCHIGHNAPGANLTNKAGNALLCQSCHADGLLATEKPLVDGNKAIPGVSGNSHSWDVPADNSAGFQTTAPDPTTPMGKRLPEGNIICSTCHNQHNNGNAGSPYLRVDNTGDAMCKVCHTIRDVQRFQDGATNKGSHPVGVIYDGGLSKLNPTPDDPALLTPGGKIECSSCHAAHDVTGALALTNDGNLLRVTNDINLCRDCHTYPQDHNGFDCLDCHEVHNTVDGTVGNNIMMIRDNINTPGGNRPVVFLNKSGSDSFVNLSGSRDGICVVCHEGLTHDNYNDTGASNHDDATDKRGQTCTSCHLHNDSFTQPVGPQSCTSCHASAQSGGRGSVVQIVGSGGEFDILSKTSTHVGGATPVEPDAITCEACHYESAGDHPTSQMLLENPESLNTVFSGTDTDVYCIGCHDGAPPTGLWTDISDTAFPGGNPYDKSSYIGIPHDTGNDTCLLCHERHGSQYPRLTKFATNYEVCNDCHDGGVASTNISSADIAIPGTSGTGHAFSTATNPVSASSGNYQTNTPSDPGMSARLVSGNIVCSTCHNPHDNTNGKLLVSTNTGDAMCKDCHSARDVGRFTDDIVNNKGSHPVGLTYVPGGNYIDPAPTLSSTQVGLVSGNIECSSCHSVHNATTTDGNLLRETMTSATCMECHNYQSHQGFNCLDCHEMHNTTNIMLIKNQIDIDLTAGEDLRTVVFNSQGTTATPVQAAAKSFADGDGIYDGICEVCHTNNPSTYHYNTSAGDHTHNAGKNCTQCHPHKDPDTGTSFPNGSCHACHEDPTPGNQLYPLTGAHEKHAGLQYGYTCSICHYQQGDGFPGHNNGNKDVVFEPGSLAFPFGADAGLTPTWNAGAKTCSNIYCHSNGRNAFRGIDNSVNPATSGNNTGIFWTSSRNQGSQSGTFTTTPAWDVGTINDCDACHSGNGNMTAPYTIAITDNNVHDPPDTGKHISSSHFSNAKDAVGNGWPGTQCFWCHNTNQPNLVETGKNQGDVQQTGMLNGTYGTSFHVDGFTYFLSESVVNGGSMINRPDGTTYSHGTTPDADGTSHCGATKTCW
ncbi:cytochrome c3 family protein [Aestuariivivens marinum]|uniref:cytochrome c3 family protein n=1 Tax=Aestuariivivens marinum TaxID=2913555 RepID=UPI001F56845E|nr:cytochrome c3 family protein [Aestuariivivens marinum]